MNNCVKTAFSEYSVTCIRCAASALWPVSTSALSSLLSCAIWVNACVTHPPTPQRTMGTDCIYHIQECSSNREEARSHRQPPPVAVHPAESLFFFHLSSSFSLSLSFLDHTACLGGCSVCADASFSLDGRRVEAL